MGRDVGVGGGVISASGEFAGLKGTGQMVGAGPEEWVGSLRIWAISEGLPGISFDRRARWVMADGPS
jgi:hypothetical protein